MDRVPLALPRPRRARSPALGYRRTLVVLAVTLALGAACTAVLRFAASPVVAAGAILWMPVVLVCATDLFLTYDLRRTVGARQSQPLSALGDPGLDGRWQLVRLEAPGRFTPSLRAMLGVSIAAAVAANWTDGEAASWALASAAVSSAAWFLLRWRAVAHVRLDYREFSFRPGGRVALAFRMRKPFGAPAEFERLSFTMQCVTETRRCGGLLRPHVRRIHAVRLDRDGELPPTPFTQELEFDVPADAPVTDLFGDPVVYWELAVLGEGPGFRWEQEFLLPVRAF